MTATATCISKTLTVTETSQEFDALDVLGIGRKHKSIYLINMGDGLVSIKKGKGMTALVYADDNLHLPAGAFRVFTWVDQFAIVAEAGKTCKVEISGEAV